MQADHFNVELRSDNSSVTRRKHENPTALGNQSHDEQCNWVLQLSLQQASLAVRECSECRLGATVMFRMHVQIPPNMGPLDA